MYTVRTPLDIWANGVRLWGLMVDPHIEATHAMVAALPAEAFGMPRKAPVRTPAPARPRTAPKPAASRAAPARSKPAPVAKAAAPKPAAKAPAKGTVAKTAAPKVVAEVKAPAAKVTSAPAAKVTAPPVAKPAGKAAPTKRTAAPKT
ncbi:MAG: hypothetical protein AAGF74_15400, partial [Pseudomonadota bacterium]